MDIADLTLEERETCFNMAADNHGLWDVYTDDIYWIRRLDKIAKAWKVERGGGKHYKLKSSQITVRAKPKELSAEEKERRAARLRPVLPKNSLNSGNSGNRKVESDVDGIATNGIEKITS